MLATHELVHGVPQRPDWQQSVNRAASILDLSGRDLLQGLGFQIARLDGPVSVLVSQGTKIAAALFLDRSDAVDVASARFSGQSPIGYALARADRERLPYVVVAQDGQLRLYAAGTGVGVGSRGRTKTFIQLYLSLLRRDQAGYLWLLLSSDALVPGGTFEDILARSADYAADLSNRLRDRIYKQVVPELAMAIVDARDLIDPSAEELDVTFQLALTLLFRLLFIAYAEDKELLPYRTNERYETRSLKRKAHELQGLIQDDQPFSADPIIWEEVQQLIWAIDHGRREWGVPEYDGGLFSSDPEESPVGAILASLSLDGRAFAQALAALLLDDTPEGLGPVDFRSLGVREFGTIYEGLLESELSVAETELAVDENNVYTPTDTPEEAVVQTGEIYLHNASGARKATGSYYTKNFAVEHLLDHALEPAIDEHLERLDTLDEQGAGERFFDYRVADIAMGSGHFLVAAVDRIERRFSAYLSERALPAVSNELARLRTRAQNVTEELGESFEIDEGQLLRRQIARRCIYGVDLNPMAVELARLSLWIHTFVPGLPLSLLNYNLVPGNSLVGIASLDEAKELLAPIDAERSASGGGFTNSLFSLSAKQLLGDARDALDRVGRLADADAAEIAQAREAHHEAKKALRPTEALFDILAASRLDEDIREKIESGAATHWVKDKDSLPDSEVHTKARDSLSAIPPFHFPVAFPGVFLRGRPGFDVILGNPPWEEATLEEDRFWIRYAPGLQALPQRDQEQIKAEMREQRPDLVEKYRDEIAKVSFLREVLVSGPYPGMGTGDPDLYKAFVWRFWSLARSGGHVGVVLPRSALAAKGSQELRKTIFSSGTVDDITTLVNNRQWVFEDIHPQYTVALISFNETAPTEETAIPLRGPFRSLSRFNMAAETEPVRFKYQEVLGWTDTAALPLLPDYYSARVFAQLRSHPRLDLDDGESWRARPYRELDATNDKRGRDGTQLMHFVEEPPDGFWPIFKGQSFDIWNPDTGTYYAWGDPNDMLEHLQGKRERASRYSRSPFSEFDQSWITDPSTLPCLSPRIAFRDISRATDTRTVRAALVPPGVFIQNTAPTLLWPRGDEKDEAFLLGILCSIPLDWYARRFVETHLNYHVFNPFPIPRPSRENPLWQRAVKLSGRLAAQDERFANWADAVGVEHGPMASDDFEEMVTELDAVVAHLYGLTEEHLQHIFETFHEGWDFHGRLEQTLHHYREWTDAL
jgi:hypothetical protein